jgi:hypothetical protein
MARRPDARLRYFAAGVRHARKIMTHELKATARLLADEIEALRRELRDIKAQVEHRRQIEAAATAEREGFWLQ